MPGGPGQASRSGQAGRAGQARAAEKARRAEPGERSQAGRAAGRAGPGGPARRAGQAGADRPGERARPERAGPERPKRSGERSQASRAAGRAGQAGPGRTGVPSEPNRPGGPSGLIKRTERAGPSGRTGRASRARQAERPVRPGRPGQQARRASRTARTGRAAGRAGSGEQAAGSSQARGRQARWTDQPDGLGRPTGRRAKPEPNSRSDFGGAEEPPSRADALSAPTAPRGLGARPPGRMRNDPVRAFRGRGQPECSPEGIRTLATALRGRRPRPLDDGARTCFLCFRSRVCDGLNSIRSPAPPLAGVVALGYQDSNLD